MLVVPIVPDPATLKPSTPVTTPPDNAPANDVLRHSVATIRETF